MIINQSTKHRIHVIRVFIALKVVTIAITGSVIIVTIISVIIIIVSTITLISNLVICMATVVHNRLATIGRLFIAIINIII